MNDERIQVNIKGVVPTPAGSGVFLQGETKIMSIFVDPMATRALTLALEGEVPPRPLTHDLMISILGGLGVQVKEVFIHAVEDETFYARLQLEQISELGTNLLEVDARPSDGMTLAAHLDVPITVARPVWDQVEDMTWAFSQIQSTDGPDAESTES